MASDTSLHDDSVPFISLPTEIHLEIVSYLPYPDALALKHTNRYFYSIIKTGVALKVDWVIERSTRRLQVPGKSCSFRTDETFCRGEVRSIMERRRWHQECKPDVGGCLVVEGASCGGSSPLNFLMRKRLGLLLKRSIGGIEMQVAVLAVVFCIFAIAWQHLAGDALYEIGPSAGPYREIRRLPTANDIMSLFPIGSSNSMPLGSSASGEN